MGPSPSRAQKRSAAVVFDSLSQHPTAGLPPSTESTAASVSLSAPRCTVRPISIAIRICASAAPVSRAALMLPSTTDDALPATAAATPISESSNARPARKVASISGFANVLSAKVTIGGAARKVGPNGRVIGVDMTDEMIAKANDNIKASGLTNVVVKKGIIEELPVKSASVDWVISNCVINLSPEKPRVFREIARVLKPGGTMLVSDIVAENLPEEILKSPALHSSCVAGAISEKEYIAGLEAAGLTDVQVLNRLVYDDAQLESFIDSELSELKESVGCCGGLFSKGSSGTKALISLVSGNIWSAKIKARKQD